jgi:hypothetical protein
MTPDEADRQVWRTEDSVMEAHPGLHAHSPASSKDHRMSHQFSPVFPYASVSPAVDKYLQKQIYICTW